MAYSITTIKPFQQIAIGQWLPYQKVISKNETGTISPFIIHVHRLWRDFPKNQVDYGKSRHFFLAMIFFGL